ncbi:MAG TPA: hypothetical protein VKZ63_05405 [Kofleriaceae bacterium]|nr:hypothetical protein [Kofleriaceae bacterium]
MSASAPLDRLAFVVLEATGIPESARVALLCLIGLLLVILGFLIAFALIIRRRAGSSPAPRAAARMTGGARDESAGPAVASGAGGLEAVTRTESMACPTCRHQYESVLEFCPRDARKLVPLSRLDARAGGSVCPACRRGFDPGTRFCPHDGSELVAVAVYEATRRDSDPTEPTGVMAKICPQCRSRHDLAATFCGRDGSELVAIN